jgi:hypothetical protein
MLAGRNAGSCIMRNSKTVSRSKSKKASKPSILSDGGTGEPIKGWRKALAEQIATALKITEPGQKLANLALVARALVRQATKGDIKTLELLVHFMKELDINDRNTRRFEITERMTFAEAMKVYRENISRVPDDD